MSASRRRAETRTRTISPSESTITAAALPAQQAALIRTATISRSPRKAGIHPLPGVEFSGFGGRRFCIAHAPCSLAGRSLAQAALAKRLATPMPLSQRCCIRAARSIKSSTSPTTRSNPSRWLARARSSALTGFRFGSTRRAHRPEWRHACPAATACRSIPPVRCIRPCSAAGRAPASRSPAAAAAGRHRTATKASKSLLHIS